MELGGTERRPRQAGVGHDPLRGQLEPEVAEHRAVDATDQWDPVQGKTLEEAVELFVDMAAGGRREARSAA